MAKNVFEVIQVIGYDFLKMLLFFRFFLFLFICTNALPACVSPCVKSFFFIFKELSNPHYRKGTVTEVILKLKLALCYFVCICGVCAYVEASSYYIVPGIMTVLPLIN